MDSLGHRRWSRELEILKNNPELEKLGISAGKHETDDEIIRWTIPDPYQVKEPVYGLLKQSKGYPWTAPIVTVSGKPFTQDYGYGVAVTLSKALISIQSLLFSAPVPEPQQSNSHRSRPRDVRKRYRRIASLSPGQREGQRTVSRSRSPHGTTDVIERAPRSAVHTTFSIKADIKATKDHDDTCLACDEGGDLLCCDGPDCRRSMHLDCARLVTVPDGKWYCSECRPASVPSYTNPSSSSSRAGSTAADAKEPTAADDHDGDNSDGDDDDGDEYDDSAPDLLVIDRFRDFLCASDEKMWMTTYGQELWGVIQLHLRFGRADGNIHVGNQCARSHLLKTEGKLSDYPVPTGKQFKMIKLTGPLVKAKCHLCQLKRTLTFKLTRVRDNGSHGRDGCIGPECATRLTHLQSILKLVFDARQWYAKKTNTDVRFSASDVPKRISLYASSITNEVHALNGHDKTVRARYANN